MSRVSEPGNSKTKIAELSGECLGAVPGNLALYSHQCCKALRDYREDVKTKTMYTRPDGGCGWTHPATFDEVLVVLRALAEAAEAAEALDECAENKS